MVHQDARLAAATIRSPVRRQSLSDLFTRPYIQNHAELHSEPCGKSNKSNR